MASEQSGAAVNGNYAQMQAQAYGIPEHNFNAHSATNSVSAGADATSATTNGNSSSSDIPKDEVGWYFVEQYYTTLSRNPEKLFLFYNKKSQYVSGTETEKVAVCVGQKSINDRIKDLNFQDCKVRVTNVDSQGSGSNIVIQVIGEISNKSAPQHKFTQTFVLAEQQNGYFVLNDIFRYIAEDDEVSGEDEAQSAQPEVAGGHQEAVSSGNEEVPATLTSSGDPAEQEHDAGLVDAGIEKAINESKESDTITEEAPPNKVEGDVDIPDSADVLVADEAPVAAVTASDETLTPTPAPEASEPTPVEPEAEKPQDPEPTPVASPPKAATPKAATQSAPPKSSAPKTWANILGGNRVATPITPATSSAPAAAAPAVPSTTPKAAAPAAAPAAAAPASPTASPIQEQERVETPLSSGSEWQTAGHDHGKKQGRTQSAQTQPPVDNTRAYIKNVSETIDANALRTALSKAAEVTYLDINRQKNCAFVDFATAAQYQAAISANPYEVGGERLYVEERRIRPGVFVGPFNGPRGGGPRVGRGGPEGRPGQGRGGFQGKEGGRGGFAPRGRGGSGGRGRGGAPVAA